MIDYIYPEWTTNSGSMPEFPKDGFLEIEYRDGHLRTVGTDSLFSRINNLWDLRNDENDIVSYRFVTPVKEESK